MDLSKLTQKAQEALQNAHTMAIRLSHQEVDGEHLFLALLEQDNGLVPRILDKIGVTSVTTRARLEQELADRPKLSGSTESGKMYVTQRLNRLLVQAGDEAKRLRDEYISVEHLLLGLADEGQATAAGRILIEVAAGRKAILEALQSIRGNQRVTSDNPEGQYEALEKYGVDLAALARDGKLDPIVGRDAEIRSVVRILSRKTKNNPVLIGEPGVGKTAIAEGLAQRIEIAFCAQH